MLPHAGSPGLVPALREQPLVFCDLREFTLISLTWV